ncbi:MAG: IclR family transcriptional regulator [bacterium]
MSIQSVKRALRILSLFSPSQSNLGITEISRAMDLPKPTVHGLVHTLLEEGYLQQDHQTRKYAIGLKVVELGLLFSSSIRINQVGGELVQRLAVSAQHNTRIATWDKDAMLITLNAFPTVEYFQMQQIGPRVPAYCTSIGKAVLMTLSEAELKGYLERVRLQAYTANTITNQSRLRADLEKARENGYAAEKSEFLMGMCCVATPVFDHAGKAMGAISVSGTIDLFNDKLSSKILPQLIQTGLEISRKLGYYPEVVSF